MSKIWTYHNKERKDDLTENLKAGITIAVLSGIVSGFGSKVWYVGVLTGVLMFVLFMWNDFWKAGRNAGR